MIERIVGLQVLACGRNAEAREELSKSFILAGARVQQAIDPASALSMVATASASGDAVRLIVVDGTGLQPGDLDLYQRVCALFGAPRIAFLLAGGDEAGGSDIVKVASAFDESALAAAVARALGGSSSAPCAPAPVIAPVIASPCKPAAARKIRVLLAEDNEVNQLVAVGMLNSLGYASQVAPNGADAVAAMEREEFDLVLMDVRMPVMDGLEATRRIRQMGGPAGGVPIIAVTANAMRGDEEACLNAGMNDYLAKPIRLATLDAAIKRWLTAR